MKAIEIPEGYFKVSKEEFFTRVNILDVCPTTTFPYRTEWKTRAGTVIGITWPGWKNPGGEVCFTLKGKRNENQA